MKNSRSLTCVVVFPTDPPRGRSRTEPKKVLEGGGSFLLRSYSSDLNLKATTTNRMHSSDLEAFGKKSNF